MSTGQKITFGNKTVATGYSTKQKIIQRSPTSFGFVSGDNVQATSVPYQAQSTKLYGATTSTYPAYSENVVYAGQTTTPVYTSPVNVSTARVDTNVNYTGGYNYTASQAKPGQTTKITFGGKPHSEVYTPVQQTTYVQPVPIYETYRQPTEIQTITSQPIREEVRYEQRVEPVRTEYKEEYTSSVPAPVVERKKKTKKGGCPSWLWILLGLLVLAGLIVGLVFLFGGFGKGAAPSGTIVKPTVNGTTNVELEDGKVTTNATTETATTTNVTEATTEETTEETTVQGTEETTQETTTEETGQVSTTEVTKNETSGTTYVTPSQTTNATTTTTTNATTVVTPTTTTNATTVVVPTTPTTNYTTTNATTTTTNATTVVVQPTQPVQTTVQEEEQFIVEPEVVAAIPQTTTTTSTYSYTTATPSTTTYDASSTKYYQTAYAPQPTNVYTTSPSTTEYYTSNTFNDQYVDEAEFIPEATAATA